MIAARSARLAVTAVIEETTSRASTTEPATAEEITNRASTTDPATGYGWGRGGL